MLATFLWRVSMFLTYLWRWKIFFYLCYGVRKIDFNIFMALKSVFLSVLWRLELKKHYICIIKM